MEKPSSTSSIRAPERPTQGGLLRGRLIGQSRDDILHIGPVASLKIDGPSLRAGRSGEVAFLRHGLWHKGNRSFALLEIDAPVEVIFSHPRLGLTERVGTFHGLRLINGSLWGARGQIELIGRLEEGSDGWRVAACPIAIMPVLVLRPAASDDDTLPL